MTALGRPSKKKLERLRLADRRAKVMNLRLRGFTIDQIRQELYDEHELQVTMMTVSKDIKHELERLEEASLSSAHEIRTVQLERIQTAMRAIWNKVLKGELMAVREMLHLMEREAKLTGADAPAKIDIEGRLRSMAEEDGLDPDEAVRTAERVMREARAEG